MKKYLVSAVVGATSGILAYFLVKNSEEKIATMVEKIIEKRENEKREKIYSMFMDELKEDDNMENKIYQFMDDSYCEDFDFDSDDYSYYDNDDYDYDFDDDDNYDDDGYDYDFDDDDDYDFDDDDDYDFDEDDCDIHDYSYEIGYIHGFTEGENRDLSGANTNKDTYQS